MGTEKQKAKSTLKEQASILEVPDEKELFGQDFRKHTYEIAKAKKKSKEVYQSKSRRPFNSFERKRPFRKGILFETIWGRFASSSTATSGRWQQRNHQFPRGGITPFGQKSQFGNNKKTTVNDSLPQYLFFKSNQVLEEGTGSSNSRTKAVPTGRRFMRCYMPGCLSKKV